jgi:hypothetical protein
MGGVPQNLFLPMAKCNHIILHQVNFGSKIQVKWIRLLCIF